MYQKFLTKFNLKNESVAATAVTVVPATVFFVGTNFFEWNILKILGIFLLTMILLILFVVTMKAGMTVFKSLLVTNVSLTLLIFLSDSYCESTFRDQQGDNALYSVLTIGFLFVIYDFVRELIKLIEEENSRIKLKGGWSWEAVVVSGLFLIFTGAFVAMVLHITVPIVLDVCVFRESLLK